MKSILYVVVICLSLFTVESKSEEPAKSAQKAVLITGASSGLGRVMAEHLAEAGYFVYAGARKDEDIAALNQIAFL